MKDFKFNKASRHYPKNKRQACVAAQAVNEARIVIGMSLKSRYLDLLEKETDNLLYELEMQYWRMA